MMRPDHRKGTIPAEPAHPILQYSVMQDRIIDEKIPVNTFIFTRLPSALYLTPAPPFVWNRKSNYLEHRPGYHGSTPGERAKKNRDYVERHYPDKL